MAERFGCRSQPPAESDAATPAMTDDTLLPFALPSVQRKKLTAAFDGGRISSDGGVMLLGLAERRIGVAEKLAAEIADRRDPTRVVHSLADILRARILAIACGYEDADDLDHLRSDPALKLACGHLPDSGRDLCSQPTMSRWENAPTLREVIRLMRVMVALYCSSYDKPPAAVTLDIDDTLDVVHGHQQLSMFNAHYDERCFLPIHVYDTATSRPVAVLLRPGKTPSGREIRGHLRRLVRRNSPPLAAHPHHHSRRQPLRAARGDGLVRRQRHHLRVRPIRQRRAAPPGRTRGRRRARAPGRGECRGAARLHRDALRREIVVCGAARRGTDRGHFAGSRHPLRGDQPDV